MARRCAWPPDPPATDRKVDNARQPPRTCPLLPPIRSAELTTAGRADDLSAHRDPVAVEQLIARVLSDAHRTAEALDAPAEARAILDLAHSFAEELAAINPRFDRTRFI
jgi:hypothetical protein